MIVILNPRACGGKAARKWGQVESEIRSRLGPFEIYPSDDAAGCREFIGKRLIEGEREFVAAGGDGTVNMLLNILLEQLPIDDWHDLKVGAIGLGSSNDFHKPFDKHGRIGSSPCRIDFHSAAAHDVGHITYNNLDGDPGERYWIINCSVGVTAEANRFFNNPDIILNFLKRSSTGLAILYSALRTLATYRAVNLTINSNNLEGEHITVENLGVVKNPHFSGDFCYGSPIEPCSGAFYVHLMEKKSMAAKLLALWSLARPHSAQPMIQSWRAKNLTMTAETALAVEFDGEVITSNSVAFSIIQGAIKLCN
jgi:diacylglycerol kinase (ATP)